MGILVLEVNPGGNLERSVDGCGIVGRGPRSDIQLDDPFVSRRHARLISGELGMAIQDLASANGVYVNGRQSPGITPLHPGDVVQMGGTVWLV
jgi:pSer/pThr/pTyr-binding forkhead associated (FHA) protein